MSSSPTVLSLSAALAVVLTTGVAASPASAGPHRAPATISGSVWTDLDGDGVRDAGEPALAGASVTVQRRGTVRGRTIFKAVAKRTSAADGHWSFSVKSAGGYRVLVTLPAGAPGFSPVGRSTKLAVHSAVSAAGLSKVMAMGPSSRPVQIAAGVRPRVSAPTSVVEPAPAPAAPAAAALPPTPTAAQIPQSTDLPPAATPTPTPAPSDPGPPLVIKPHQPFDIGGIAWRDTNADGVRQDAEAKMTGLSVALYSADKKTLLATTPVNAFGGWSLTVPANTAYRVKITPDASTDSGVTVEHAGNDTARDSDISRSQADAYFSDVVPANVPDSHIDVGLGERLKIGDLIWLDANKNGMQDSGEDGVNAATVQLWNGARTELLSTSVTYYGNFMLGGAFMGGSSYRVRVVLPAGATVTAINQGLDDTHDSDALTTGSDAGWTKAFWVPETTTLMTNWDIGLF